jgi:hypothetical protein
MTAYGSKHSHIPSTQVRSTVLCLAYLRARDLAIATLIHLSSCVVGAADTEADGEGAAAGGDE